MPPGESSCPGSSEYVWQRGVEGVLRASKVDPIFKKIKSVFAVFKINPTLTIVEMELANLDHFFLYFPISSDPS